MFWTGIQKIDHSVQYGHDGKNVHPRATADMLASSDATLTAPLAESALLSYSCFLLSENIPSGQSMLHHAKLQIQSVF